MTCVDLNIRVLNVGFRDRMHVHNGYPYEPSETNSPPVSWLFDKLLANNASDDGLSLAASVAVNEQTWDTIDNNTSDDGLSASVAVNEQISEEMDTTQVPVVLMAGNENPSELVSINSEPELALSSFVAAELDGQPQITTPLEQPTLTTVGVEPPVSPPVVATALHCSNNKNFCRVS